MYLAKTSEGSKTVVTDIGGLEWDHVESGLFHNRRQRAHKGGDKNSNNQLLNHCAQVTMGLCIPGWRTLMLSTQHEQYSINVDDQKAIH